ncbi:MAG: DUF134 domain-containing protein [bacterium]
MPRPKNNRIVHEPPLFTDFKPVGIQGSQLDVIRLSLDEYEAIRLADLEGMSQEEASEEMGISRSTFSRLIEKARNKMAGFVIKGKWLSIQGGEIHFRKNIFRCQDCGHMFKINIHARVDKCPECHSSNLRGFGHGQCCRENLVREGGNYGKNERNRTRKHKGSRRPRS